MNIGIKVFKFVDLVCFKIVLFYYYLIVKKIKFIQELIFSIENDNMRFFFLFQNVWEINRCKNDYMKFI